MTPDELHSFLCLKADQFEDPQFIESDPISLPHRFSQKEDIEIVSLLIATIAWGNRKSIIQSGEKLLNILGESPYDFVRHYEHKEQLSFVHRTFNKDDLSFFLRSLRRIYENGSLEETFLLKTEKPHMKDRISNFRNIFFEVPHDKRSEKHISNPDKNASCKRLNMFLRWMVRSPKKGVDFGLWKNISPAELYIPLDVHTGNIARKLGIMTRTQHDWNTNEIIMEYFRKIDPSDPARFDFALFGLGAIEKF